MVQWKTTAKPQGNWDNYNGANEEPLQVIRSWARCGALGASISVEVAWRCLAADLGFSS